MRAQIWRFCINSAVISKTEPELSVQTMSSMIALAIQNGFEFARVVLSGAVVSHHDATGLELINFVIKAMETPIIILVEAMDIFNVTLKSLTKVVDILNIVLETLTEIVDIQANSIKASVKILTDSIKAPIEILIHNIKTLTGIIGAQISGIKTPAEILTGVVEAPVKVVEISTGSIVILSEIVYRLERDFRALYLWSRDGD